MPSDTHSIERIALGAIAGLVGTLVLQALRAANQEWLPATTPPIREDPGEFMVESAEGAMPNTVSRRVPDWAETAVAQGLGVGYGMTFGALYAALRPLGGPPLADGIGFGLATWAAGYLGWLPGAGLMPPVWRQKAGQVVLPAIQHVAYGVATVATYDWIQRRMEDKPG